MEQTNLQTETDLAPEKKSEITGNSVTTDTQLAINYILPGYPQKSNRNTFIFNSTDILILTTLPATKYKEIINIHKINAIRDINTWLKVANSRLPLDGKLTVCAEPSLFWKHKSHILSKERKITLSNVELMGRLCSCGFKICGHTIEKDLLYVTAEKREQPASVMDSSNSLLIRLNRIGKHGKLIKVYKIRTMRPYSEYLQEFVYAQNLLGDGGKIKDDYRITAIGRFLRKWWIDELPMIWNWVRGDIKLVGVRPVSQHYFSLYSEKLQEKRKRHKPGLIPPFYADMPRTLDEIMASEMRYLNSYEQNALKTDLIYLLRILFNIVVRGARSR